MAAWSLRLSTLKLSLSVDHTTGNELVLHNMATLTTILDPELVLDTHR